MCWPMKILRDYYHCTKGKQNRTRSIHLSHSRGSRGASSPRVPLSVTQLHNVGMRGHQRPQIRTVLGFRHEIFGLLAGFRLGGSVRHPYQMVEPIHCGCGIVRRRGGGFGTGVGIEVAAIGCWHDDWVVISFILRGVGPPPTVRSCVRSGAFS